MTYTRTDNEELTYYVSNVKEGPLESGTYSMGYNQDGKLLFKRMFVSNDKLIKTNVKDQESVMKEVNTFLNSRDKYQKYGVCHKRGYLLYGPPGCGKSSFLRLFEQEFLAQTGGLVLVWQKGIFINQFYNLVREHEGSDRPVLLAVEDIEQHLIQMEEQILEFLDGHVGLTNFIIVCTTNNLDQIPERIKNRPSRIDKRLKIDFPNAEARTLYVDGICHDQDLSSKIASCTDGLSLADIKEVVISHLILGNKYVEVAENLRNSKDPNEISYSQKSMENTFQPKSKLFKNSLFSTSRD